ncbi:MAG: DoxX family membrane protein [Gemmatimonas sp.]|nr:DoxX family membrane protein [Gemmatimonas sp.]
MESLSRYGHTILGILRIVAGLLFMQHGVQKLFGWLGGPQAELMSLLGLAGVFEMFGGLLIVLGLLTRPVAIVLAGEMLVAYFMAHLPQGFWPLQNGGELALLYLVIFLYLATAGPGRFAIDGARGKESAVVDAEPVAPTT